MTYDATEADRRNREDSPCPDGECKHTFDEWPVGSVTRTDLAFDQCPMCGWTQPAADTYYEVARLTAERDAYRAMVADLLASAYPNKRDHPTMTKAWDRARELLKHGPKTVASEVDQLRAEVERMRRVVEAADAICEDDVNPAYAEEWNRLVEAMVAYRAVRP